MTKAKLLPPFTERRAKRLVLGALIAIATSANAAGLGDISLKSHLGERLRAEIRLLGASNAHGAECFHLSAALADNSALPRLRHAAISVLQNPHRIVVTSRDAIFEPAVELAVFYGCGTYLSRSYTVLLEPREVVLAAAQPATAAASDVTRKPLAAPPAVPRNSRARMLFAGETPRDLAERLYPRSKTYQRRFLERLVSLNPGEIYAEDFDRVPANGDTLKIPPRFPPARKPAPPPAAIEKKKPAAIADTPPTEAEKPAAKSEPAPKPTADRLVLSTPEDTTAAAAQTPELAKTELEQRLRDVVGQARTLNGELATLRAEFPNPPAELQTRLLEMETRLARMELAAVRVKLMLAQPAKAEAAAAPMNESAAVAPAVVSATESAAEAAVPAAAPPPVAEPVVPPQTAEKAAASPAPMAKTAEEESGTFWWGVGLLAAFAAALAAYLIRNSARRGEDDAPLDLALPARQSQATGAAAGAAATEAPKSSATPAPLAASAAAPTVEEDLEPTTALPEFERSLPAEIEIVEVAHVLAIFGRAQAAVDVLSEFIGQHPDKALNPSLYLLKVYKQLDKRAEFEQLASHLHTDFNIQTISWDDPVEELAPIDASVHDYRSIIKELENFPHVFNRISELWGTRECLDYLQEILHENREGRREGMSLAVTNEILNLIALLQKQLHLGTPLNKD